MKLLTSLLLAIIFINSGSFYDYSLTGISGGVVPLSSFQGKKVLLITLPVVHTSGNDSILSCLDTLARNNTQLKIIGVPSREDGFSLSNRDSLMAWYRSKLGANIFISEGIYTHKSSLSSQNLLFKWLTNSSENDVFDIDPTDPGYKYFISETGSLFAVLHPHTKISSGIVQRLIH